MNETCKCGEAKCEPAPSSITENLKKLVEALEAGSYTPAPSELLNGAELEVVSLDIVNEAFEKYKKDLANTLRVGK